MLRVVTLVALTSLVCVVSACGGDESSESGAAATPDLSARLAGTIPAVAPADQEAYRQSIRGRRILQESCGYDAEIAVAECTGGRFALNPPPISEEASCIVGLAESLPVYIFCSDQGGNRQFYEVKA